MTASFSLCQPSTGVTTMDEEETGRPNMELDDDTMGRVARHVPSRGALARMSRVSTQCRRVVADVVAQRVADAAKGDVEHAHNLAFPPRSFVDLYRAHNICSECLFEEPTYKSLDGGFSSCTPKVHHFKLHSRLRSVSVCTTCLIESKGFRERITWKEAGESRPSNMSAELMDKIRHEYVTILDDDTFDFWSSIWNGTLWATDWTRICERVRHHFDTDGQPSMRLLEQAYKWNALTIDDLCAISPIYVLPVS